MQKSVTITELEERFRTVLQEVTRDHVPYVVTRGNKPEAVLVPYEEFERLVRRSEDDILRRFDEMQARIRERTAGFSEEEVAADVEAARAELPG